MIINRTVNLIINNNIYYGKNSINILIFNIKYRQLWINAFFNLISKQTFLKIFLGKIVTRHFR